MQRAENRVNVELLEWEDYIIYYEGQPFEGIAYELRPDGTLWSEECYRMGVKDGISRDWYENGARKSEDSFKLGSVHGTSREWFPNGKLKSEKTIELAYCIASREWDEAGHLIQESRMEEGSSNYALLVAARARESRRVQHIVERLSDTSTQDNDGM